MKNPLFILVAFMLLGITVKAQTFTDQIIGTGLERVDKIGEIKELFDFNNDGFEDIIYSTKTSFGLLYKNNGNSTFTDVTTITNFPIFKNAGNIYCNDLDNNGFGDLVYYFNHGGANLNDTLRIFMNFNGSFVEKTSDFGILNPIIHGTNHWNSNLIPFDYDRDGDLDILFASALITATNACNNSKVSVLVNKINEINSSFNSVVDLITYPASILAASIGVTDYNNDQLADIVVIEQSGAKGAFGGYRADPFVLYQNNGNKTFSKLNGTNLADAAMHNFITVWDYNNDGNLDFINGTSDCCGTRLNIIWKNNGNGTFADMRTTYNLHPVNDYYGRLSAVDTNNDSFFDISTTGMGGFWSDTRHQLWENNGSGFINKASNYALQIGYNGGFKGIGNTSEWFDYDNDGDLDFYTYQWNDGSNYIQSLMKNPNSLSNKYMRVKLIGSASPKDGIGSRIVLKIGNQKLTQYYNGTIGNNFSDIFHFGLGQQTMVDSLFVYWSSGNITKMTNVSANRLLTISESPINNSDLILNQVSQYGGTTEQNVYGGNISNDFLYIAGDDSGQSLLLKYPIIDINSYTWKINWPNVASPISEGFYGVVADENTVYAAGLSYSQTIDNGGGKEHKSVICQFPLNGATGSGTGGANWIAKPTFFPYSGYEGLNDITINKEQGNSYIYACGSPQANGLNNTAALTKYDTNNNLIWSKTIGNTANGQYNVPVSLSVLNNSIYIASSTGSYISSNLYSYITLWKYDTSGNLVWNKSTPTIGFSNLNAICSVGQYIYVAGNDKIPNKGNDVLIVKYNENGNVIWEKRWGGGSEDIARGIELINNKLFVVGETSSYGSGGKDAFILELNAMNGSVLDSVFYGGILNDVAFTIKKNANTPFIIGTFQGNATFDKYTLNSMGNKDIFILKMDSIFNDNSYKITPGKLTNILTKAERDTLTILKLNGTIDARDFRIMRDSMPLLAEIDLSKTKILEYTGNDGTNGINTTTYPASAIPQSAFYNQSTITAKASLTRIILPTTVTSIGNYAFLECSGLTYLQISDSVASLGKNAFQGCSSLISIKIPTKLTSIGNEVFGNCSGLTSITIPASVTSIDDGAFVNCSGLRSVTIPNSLTTIGHAAFQACSNIDTLRVGNIRNLKDHFSNYQSISKIEILAGINTLPDWTFNGWVGLKAVILPTTLRIVGASAFEECRNILSVTFAEGTTHINDYAFYNCRALKNLVLPSTLMEIGTSSFENCRSITILSLPNQLTTIGGSAFWGCTGMTNITFDINVITIGDAAFWGCNKVNSILSKSLIPPFLSGIQVFGAVDKTICELTVPVTALAAYKVAPQWKDFIFKNITKSNEIQNDQNNLFVRSEHGIISVFSSSDILSIEVVGINGQLLKQVSHVGKKTELFINKPGVYVLKVQLINGITKAMKIVN